jgi:hypothetical protein
VATALTWVVLLIGLWLWGTALTGVRSPAPQQGTRSDGANASGAGAGAGHGAPAARRLPPVHGPLGSVDGEPRRVDIPALGVRAPVVAGGVDRRGAPVVPAYAQAAVVSWWSGGARPGAAGVALLSGHRDTGIGPAVFRGLGSLHVGSVVRVLRADGQTAEFTVEDVRTLPREGFDARVAYGPRVRGRAELRLVTCAGRFDPVSRAYSANVVVSAYLSRVAPGR